MKKIILLALILGTVSIAMGSHLRCGYITAKPVDCALRKYMITITVYTSDSPVKFGGDGILYFGDGTNLTVPEVAATPRPDLGPNIGMAQFTTMHIYPNFDSFLISYVEPNRNGGVLNMSDSFFTTFYIETSILISQEYGCIASPEFLAPAILQAVRDAPFAYSLGAISSADNLITYELVVPFRDRGLPVFDYVSPDNIAINYLTGLLTWDTNFQGSSSQPGEYNFAIQANYHVKTGETYAKIGFVRIDFQVIVEGDVDDPVLIQDNQELDEYNRLLVQEGEDKRIKVFFESTETSTLQAFSELAETESFSFDTYDSTHEEKTFKVGVLTIHPDAAHIRENPYLVTVRAMSPINGWPLGSDVNYLIYTEEIFDLPVIVPPVITDVEQEGDDLEIYPNPARDKLRVHLNQSGISELTLFTIQGQRVKIQSFDSETEVILSDLPPGIYVCEIRRNNFVIRKTKVIKH